MNILIKEIFLQSGLATLYQALARPSQGRLA